ncbi:coiled-coil domain-containing protein 77 [Biomphalaria glabrata]|uniref:Coiled-coil domain-containing protein 77-like n=1 Tax=Biomphalaria glabrata TaxID=6526 RepID=A0A9U8DZI1_BIOGL|nr:coiled-coil domain-containing protein 77-like [Biomphalaria glabrata]KAI8728642.1 coiled-coil domain-containing protein 77-like [Biomphalaria glabrata]
MASQPSYSKKKLMMPQNTSIKGKLDLSKLNESLFSVPLQDVDKVVDKDDEELKGKDSPELPSINERLGHLRPSRELLEYYRKKIAEYDDEHSQLISKLEEYRMAYEEQHTMQWELRQREEEIVELQKALSDMQIYLFQEREHVLRLYAENDRLKIRELEDKKKIQTLLSLSGTEGGEVTYFIKEPPAKAIIPQRLKPKSQSENINNSAVPITNNGLKVSKKKSSTDNRSSLIQLPEEKLAQENEMLTLQIESLQAQLAEQTKLAKEQTEALLEDRRVKDEEYETRRQRDEEKIKTLTEKLHKTQDLLYDSTKDFLELRFEGRAIERSWMSEKDRLLREMDVIKQQASSSLRDNVVNTSFTQHKVDLEEVKSLEFQLQQSQKLAENYREQVIQLEDELSRLREEGDVTREVFQDRSEKMTSRLQLMNSRYQDLERRRNLEVEGFRNDIKNLRLRLKDVEKQLYKVTLGFTDDMNFSRPDDLDMQVLTNVRKTAGRSKKLVGELKNLKSKLYGLENDLRHL